MAGFSDHSGTLRSYVVSCSCYWVTAPTLPARLHVNADFAAPVAAIVHEYAAVDVLSCLVSFRWHPIRDLDRPLRQAGLLRSDRLADDLFGFSLAMFFVPQPVIAMRGLQVRN